MFSAAGARSRSGGGLVCGGLASAASVLILMLHAGAPQAAVGAQVILSGDPAPDGNGVYVSIAPPILNSGMLTPSLGPQTFFAFGATFTDTSGGEADDRGIVGGNLTDPAFTLGGNGNGGGGWVPQFNMIVRKGDSSPGGTFETMAERAINSSGQVVFNASPSGLYVGSGGPITTIARPGDEAPDDLTIGASFSTPQINDGGQVAWNGLLVEDAVNTRAILRGPGQPLDVIVRAGQPVPEVSESVFGPEVSEQLQINNTGRVAFGTAEGIFTGVGGGLSTVVKGFDSSPDGSAYQEGFGPPALNNNNAVAFHGTTLSGSGIFRHGVGDPAAIALTGDLAPGGGALAAFERPVSLNDQGDVVLLGRLEHVGGDEVLLIGDGTNLSEILREGQTVPLGNGRIDRIITWALNQNGDVVILAELRDTFFGDGAKGLLVYSASDGFARKLYQSGDPFLDSTIVDLTFRGAIQREAMELMARSDAETRSGFNDLGHVGFGFTLANGVSGITVPEPSTVAMLAGGVLGLVWRSRRRA